MTRFDRGSMAAGWREAAGTAEATPGRARRGMPLVARFEAPAAAPVPDPVPETAPGAGRVTIADGTRMEPSAAPAAPAGQAANPRAVRFAAASEEPVLRRDFETGELFLEVLGHGAGEVDLDWIGSGHAPLLKDHVSAIDWQVGIVTAARVEGGRLVVDARVSEGTAGEDVLRRLRAGELGSVSVGYVVVEARLDGDRDGVPVVRVTRWVPREVSFVALPADTTVGVGRGGPAGKTEN